MEEFCRMFRKVITSGKNETDTNDKLVVALERCDELESEVSRLRAEFVALRTCMANFCREFL